MNERRERLMSDLDSALERLSEALAAPKTDLNRDASIQRFELTSLAEEVYERLPGDHSLMRRAAAAIRGPGRVTLPPT